MSCLQMVADEPEGIQGSNRGWEDQARRPRVGSLEAPAGFGLTDLGILPAPLWAPKTTPTVPDRLGPSGLGHPKKVQAPAAEAEQRTVKARNGRLSSHAIGSALGPQSASCRSRLR